MSDLIRFENVSYTYFPSPQPVFTRLELRIPPGITTLAGQNGTGKSTLLLLAGGRLIPTAGDVFIEGVNTRDLGDEEQRNRLVSFVYQNLEFETDETVSNLLHMIAENGSLTDGEALIPRLIEIMELETCLERPTRGLSKGEMQRTILAFSLLYGSRIIMMDEPVFALEDRQKQKIFRYLTGYTREQGISLLYSAHERELSRQYSDHLLLFYRDGRIRLDRPEMLDDRATMEDVYEIPQALLYQKEQLYRKHLLEVQDLLDSSG